MKMVMITIGVLLLAACSEKVHDVEYYKTHEAERKAVLEKCRNNPGQMRDDPNCLNADRAQWTSGKNVGTGAAEGF